MLKPSEIVTIRYELFTLIAFETWDHITKSTVDRYMKNKNLQYRAASLLDEHGRLYIDIIDNGKIHTIVF